MFIVPIYVGKSGISGLGIFAAERISKGQRIWEFVPKIDVEFTAEEWAKLPARIRSLLEEHAWQSYPGGSIYYEATAGKYINHSDTPNTDFTQDGVGFAALDIEAHEELTSDYREFMADCSHLDFIS